MSRFGEFGPGFVNNVCQNVYKTMKRMILMATGLAMVLSAAAQPGGEKPQRPERPQVKERPTVEQEQPKMPEIEFDKEL